MDWELNPSIKLIFCSKVIDRQEPVFHSIEFRIFEGILRMQRGERGRTESGDLGEGYGSAVSPGSGWRDGVSGDAGSSLYTHDWSQHVWIEGWQLCLQIPTASMYDEIDLRRNGTGYTRLCMREEFLGFRWKRGVFW